MKEAHAGLFRHEGAGREFALLVLSDRPDVCAAASEGSINLEMFEVFDVRPSTRTLAWTIIAPDAPISAGPVPLGVPGFEDDAPAVAPPDEGQYGFPMLSSTPARCGDGDPYLSPDSVPMDLSQGAFSVSFNLTEYSSSGAGGDFTLEHGSDRLDGKFEAPVCPLPETTADFRGCP